MEHDQKVEHIQHSYLIYMLMVKHIRHDVIYEDLAQFCHLAGEFVTDAFAKLFFIARVLPVFIPAWNL